MKNYVDREALALAIRDWSDASSVALRSELTKPTGKSLLALAVGVEEKIYNRRDLVDPANAWRDIAVWTAAHELAWSIDEAQITELNGFLAASARKNTAAKLATPSTEMTTAELASLERQAVIFVMERHSLIDGEVIAFARKSMGMTIYNFAVALGVPTLDVMNLETMLAVSEMTRLAVLYLLKEHESGSRGSAAVKVHADAANVRAALERLLLRKTREGGG